MARFSPSCSQPVLQPFVESVAESVRQIKYTPILDQLNDVTSALQDRGAVGASFEMGFQASAQFRADVILQIIGDLAPYFFASDLNHHKLPSNPRFSFIAGCSRQR
jgi:hypothetical protein